MTSTKTHDPVAAAKALAHQIRAAKDEIQSQCKLPDSLVKAMVQGGLFQLYVPRVLGGPETDPITAFRAVEELSRVDGSVGWCSFVASAVSIYAAWIPAEPVRGGPRSRTRLDRRSCCPCRHGFRGSPYRRPRFRSASAGLSWPG